MLTGIINYLEIYPWLGTAGQPTGEQLTDVKAAGYERVINLLPATSTSALPGEADLVAALGMAYRAIPVIWQQPTAADLEQFFHELRQGQGRKTFVHCAMNMRVSAFVFLYRVKVEGVPVEEARETMLKIWEPDEVWGAFIDGVLNKTEI